MLFIGNKFKKKHLLVSESYCRIAIVLFIYVSYTNKICLYQLDILKCCQRMTHIFIKQLAGYYHRCFLCDVIRRH